MKKLVTMCFTAGLVLVVTQLAGAAAISNSTAVFDWGSLWIEFKADPVVEVTQINWSSWQSGSQTGADNLNGDSDYADEELSGLVDTSASAVVPYASGAAWTTDSEVGETVEADTAGQGPFEASSWAYAWRWGIFTATGSGIMTVKVNYSLEQTLSTDLAGDVAEGYSQVSLSLNNWDTGDDYGDSAEIVGGPVADGASFFDSRNGSFTVQGYFFDGDTGGLLLDVYNDASVVSVTPEPATLGLLAMGGLVMLRRKWK